MIPVDELPSELGPRAQAEILVLGQIRDSLMALTNSVTDVRERVIRIEASDVASHIGRVEAYIAKKEEETEKIRKDGLDRISKLELESARWKGLFAPIAILGAGLMGGLATFITDRLTNAS